MPGPSGVAPKKVVARVALIGLEPAAAAIMRDSFKQFGIDTRELPLADADRLGREKFEGCVLRLDDDAEAVLNTARTSRSNRRVVVYGICDSAQKAMRFSRYGVNAVLRDPVDRQDALKVVRATHLLVIHELRCYVRIPLVTAVSVQVAGRSHRATTQEVSGGGMSVQAGSLPPMGEDVAVTFDLPNRPGLTLHGKVCWTRENESLFGVRFGADDPARGQVRNWIDEYLDIQ
jgi:hypothetical protein